MEVSDRPRGEALGKTHAVTFLITVIAAYLLVGIAAYQAFVFTAAHV